MVTMKELKIIRRMYYRDGLSLSRIVRRTDLTRKTVRKWLNPPEQTEPKYRRRMADVRCARSTLILALGPVMEGAAAKRRLPSYAFRGSGRSVLMV